MKSNIEQVISPGSISSKESRRREAIDLIRRHGGQPEACQPSAMSGHSGDEQMVRVAKDVSLGAVASAVDELAFVATIERLVKSLTGPKEVTEWLRLALSRREKQISANMWRTMAMAGSDAVCLTGAGVSYIVGSDHLASYGPTTCVTPMTSINSAGVDYEWLCGLYSDSARWAIKTDAAVTMNGEVVATGESKPRS